MAMHLDDKGIIHIAARVSALHAFHGEELDYLRLCAPPYIKKHGCLLSCNHVSAFLAFLNGRDKALPEAFIH
ncbi:MAG TPA: hypothetical protein VIU43_02185 [Nitrosospira sp.]